MLTDLFKNKKCNLEKLFAYGFVQQGEAAVYASKILHGAFTLYVTAAADGGVDTEVIDNESGEPYVLYKTNAVGAYVGEIRAAVAAALQDIADACYDAGVFKTRQAAMLTDHIRATYGDELEFLWPKFPDNAVWRRRDSRKWYGIILTVNGRKIGMDVDQSVEILDLRMRAEERETLLAKEHYYPGWHMNKTSWYAIALDNGVADEEIKLRVASSYELAKK